MSSFSRWDRFWKGTGWLLFFFKFFLFSIIAFFVWSLINISYGKLLCEAVLRYERRITPIMNARYSDLRGLTLTLTLAPAENEVLPLEKPESFELHVYPNTLHFNIIPFLAIFFATPVRSWKHLSVFLVMGLLVLMISHFLHLHLNIRSYYFSHQTFVFDRSVMSQEAQMAGDVFLTRIKLLRLLQGFMEQAGSMIMPFLLWMIYGQKWLFRKLLTTASTQHSSTPPTNQPPGSPK